MTDSRGRTLLMVLSYHNSSLPPESKASLLQPAIHLPWYNGDSAATAAEAFCSTPAVKAIWPAVSHNTCVEHAETMLVQRSEGRMEEAMDKLGVGPGAAAAGLPSQPLGFLGAMQDIPPSATQQFAKWQGEGIYVTSAMFQLPPGGASETHPAPASSGSGTILLTTAPRAHPVFVSTYQATAPCSAVFANTNLGDPSTCTCTFTSPMSMEVALGAGATIVPNRGPHQALPHACAGDDLAYALGLLPAAVTWGGRDIAGSEVSSPGCTPLGVSSQPAPVVARVQARVGHWQCGGGTPSTRVLGHDDGEAGCDGVVLDASTSWSPDGRQPWMHWVVTGMNPRGVDLAAALRPHVPAFESPGSSLLEIPGPMAVAARGARLHVVLVAHGVLGGISAPRMVVVDIESQGVAESDGAAQSDSEVPLTTARGGRLVVRMWEPLAAPPLSLTAVTGDQSESLVPPPPRLVFITSYVGRTHMGRTSYNRGMVRPAPSSTHLCLAFTTPDTEATTGYGTLAAREGWTVVMMPDLTAAMSPLDTDSDSNTMVAKLPRVLPLDYPAVQRAGGLQCVV